MLAPVLRELAAVHRSKRTHGNLSPATVSIRVQGAAVGTAVHTVHLAPTVAEAAPRAIRCVRCMPPEDKCASGASSQAGDIWAVGIIALQMLLGRQCRFAESGECCSGLVDRCTGELPILPVGLSLECIDFLVDCLGQEPARRPSAFDLLGHAFLQPFAPASSSATTSSPSQACAEEEIDALQPLMHVLLIADDVRTKPASCRPLGVPRLQVPLWETRVRLESSIHTSRACSCKQRDSSASHEPARAFDGVPQDSEAGRGCAALPRPHASMSDSSMSAGYLRPDCATNCATAATDGKWTLARGTSLQQEMAASQLPPDGQATTSPFQAVGDPPTTPQPHRLAPRRLKRKSSCISMSTTGPSAVKKMSPANTAEAAHALLPAARCADLEDEATHTRPHTPDRCKCLTRCAKIRISPQTQAAMAKIESSALACIASHGHHTWAHEVVDVFGGVGGAGFARLPSSPSSSPEQIPMPFPTGLLPPLQI